MIMRVPMRLGAAETTLIAQLESVGAGPEAARLGVAGLPTRRVESYHYTDLKQLLRTVPPLATAGDASGATVFDGVAAYRLGIVNGRVQPPGAAPAGVIAGTARGAALTERDDILVRLNTALAGETLTLAIEGSVDGVIHIDRRSTGEAGHAASSAHVFVADGARATLLETYSTSAAAHLGNHATYIQLGKGAVLTHVTVDLSNRLATHFATHEYQLADGAQLRTLAVHAGATLERTQMFARFAGEGAHADFTGLNLVGDGQHADMTLDISHAVPRCSSKPLFKQVARGHARAVFQGKIIVARDAQKTDAKLMMQGLMLSDEAEILSKPELEIYADDVVCGHGSTAGQLDEDSLFYLVSRGIPKADAETMLVRGFLAEVLEPITDEALNGALNGVVDDWLAGK
jgi:Fe-S cluster assembly protein SufD